MEETDVVQKVEGPVPAIRSLIARSVELQEEGTKVEHELAELARTRTESTATLLSFASTTNQYSKQQTAMAEERTALTREQTRLSTRSTELANIRKDLLKASVVETQCKLMAAPECTFKITYELV